MFCSLFFFIHAWFLFEWNWCSDSGRQRGWLRWKFAILPLSEIRYVSPLQRFTFFNFLRIAFLQLNGKSFLVFERIQKCHNGSKILSGTYFGLMAHSGIRTHRQFSNWGLCSAWKNAVECNVHRWQTDANRFYNTILRIADGFALLCILSEWHRFVCDWSALDFE